jgi:hypothetical protein
MQPHKDSDLASLLADLFTQVNGIEDKDQEGEEVGGEVQY